MPIENNYTNKDLWIEPRILKSMPRVAFRKPDQSVNSGSVTVAIRQISQDSVNQVGQQITRKNLNVQPTLTVRPGFPLRIIINKDLILRPYVQAIPRTEAGIMKIKLGKLPRSTEPTK